MLVRIDYKVNTEDGRASFPRNHVVRVLGSPARIGEKVGDLLVEERPSFYGTPAVVESMTLTIMPDPEMLNGR